MGLNISKGNMYPFVTHTFNMIKGRCSHDCVYCYMKQFPLNDLRFDKKELKTDLGQGNFIFVGSSTDMWAKNIPSEWIRVVLKYCRAYNQNKYLFQSKNPQRFIGQYYACPKNTVFGTTIETNRDIKLSEAPSVHERIKAMNALESIDCKTMITIEPIVDFDLEPFTDMLIGARPEWVNIGADSKGHNLPEPSYEKVSELINKLSLHLHVKVKSNLKRLLSP